MVDPILMEVVRSRLEALVDEGARTIQRTGISPVVADAGDCSCSLFDDTGGLIAGGGAVQQHFKTGSNGVLEILKRHGETIKPGDIFAVNDPYNGGGFHAQDIFIHVPIFVDDELIAWAGCSAHMMDMGGAVPGSFVPEANDCVQEALRFPPVRLASAGVEQHEMWSIIRNNIRMPDLIEMDIRALISGCNVVRDTLESLVSELTTDSFREIVNELAFLTEREMRKRIQQLEEGEYYSVSWTEWTDALFTIPCTLTVKDDLLEFSYVGASPQSGHYFNSKPYVIKSLLGVEIASHLARDLPFNEGVFRAFKIVCEPGSITDANAPAPIGGPHLDVGQNAVEVAMRSLTMAVVASEDSLAKRTLSGPTTGSGYGLHTWAGIGLHGQPDGWLMLEGGAPGGAASFDRDGNDFYQCMVGKGSNVEIADVELMESWYPIEYQYRRVRSGLAGAGKFRGGCGSSIAYKTTGEIPLQGAILGNRERVPIVGTAGGYPAALTEFMMTEPSGEQASVPCHSQDNLLRNDQIFHVEVCGGPGWGDPLQRDPEAVDADVRWGRLTAQEAEDIYGVIVDNEKATKVLREKKRRERLERAEPPLAPIAWTKEVSNLAESPKAKKGTLYPGVEQRGGVAVSLYSEEPLAISPNCWTQGCAVIRNYLESAHDCETVAYLDPHTGDLIAVDVIAEGIEKSFDSKPNRWVSAQPKVAIEV